MAMEKKKRYPQNPNGSDLNTAMLCDTQGETIWWLCRHYRSDSIFQMNWHHIQKVEEDEVSPWLKAIVNARKWLRTNND